MNSKVLFYALGPEDSDVIGDAFIGTPIMDVYLTGEGAVATGVTFKMTDGRRIHFQVCGDVLVFAEEGLAEA